MHDEHQRPANKKDVGKSRSGIYARMQQHPEWKMGAFFLLLLLSWNGLLAAYSVDSWVRWIEAATERRPEESFFIH